MYNAYTLNTMLREHGRTVTLKLLSSSNYNAVTGKVTKTPQLHSVKAYFYNDVPEITENTARVSGSKRAVISNFLTNGITTPEPKVQDVISVVGKEDAVITKVSPIVSGSNLVCYLLHLDT